MRTILILIVILFASGDVFGQENDSTLIVRYGRVSDSLSNLSDYKNAILYRKRVLNLLQNQRPVQFEQLAGTYRTIGYYYRKWGKYDESLYYQQRAIEIAENRLDSNHIELARAYNGYGSYFYAQGKYNLCFQYFYKALQISLRAGYPTIGDYYNNVGIAQQNLGEEMASLQTYRKALAYNLATFGLYHENTAHNYENIGTLYYNLGQYDSAIRYLDTVEVILDSLSVQGSPKFASLYNNLGAVYTAIGDFRKAFSYLDAGIRIYEKYLGSDHPDVANIYANTGLLLLDQGDLDKALAYLKKALAIREVNFGKLNPSVARTLLYLGNCYLEKRNFEDAYNHLTEALTVFQQINVAPGEIADTRNELGLYFEKIGSYEEALNQYNLALEINAGKLDRDAPDVANSYARIGRVLLLQEKFEEAGNYFDKALAIRERLYGSRHPDVADSYRLMALSCPGNEACIEWALRRAIQALNYHSDFAEPFETAISPIGLLRVFQAQGQLYQGLYEKRADIGYLELADSVYANSIHLINFIKTSLEQPGSKLALQDNFYQIYEEAILVKYKLQQLTGNPAFWYQAFEVSEQSNAILLMEALQSVDAERFAGIPDSLVAKERQLKIDLAYLEKQRFEQEMQMGGGDRKVLRMINDHIFDLHEEQHRLLSYFREKHPDYFKLKYEPKITDVRQIQRNLLHADQTMLAYFVGEDHLFVFIISKDNFEIVRIDKDFPLEIWVEDFRSSIYQFNPAKKELGYLNQKLANIGHELYLLLFEPVADKVNTTSLIIVPGGVLGYLPFDALLASPTSRYGDFDLHDYLIHHYRISYSYSATLLYDMVKGRHKKRPFIAFAPSYFGDTLQVNRGQDPWRAVLSQLRFNVQEVLQINEMMNGEVYLDSLATEEKFMERAPHAGILHLATHGKSNDRHGEYSYLAFYQYTDSLENELVFVKNLYNMKIPASLVVLSACETGIGELQRGEGIVSLARGFSYAGAGSIVTTLWSIDDNASANIMVDFYRHLKEGLPKDEALRQAKLDYITNNIGNNRTHPLYWAAFVPVGNMEPLYDDFPLWAYLLLTGIVGIAGFYGWFYARKK